MAARWLRGVAARGDGDTRAIAESSGVAKAVEWRRLEVEQGEAILAQWPRQVDVAAWR